MLNGRLYVMGGVGCNKLQVLEISEENEFSWTVKADLPEKRFKAASAVVNGKLWLIGGGGRLEDPILIYNPESDTWASGPPLPFATKHAVAAAMHDGELFLISDRGTLIYRDGGWQDIAGVPTLRGPSIGSVLLG